MLVLSRKIGEQVVLPDCGVTIQVVAVSGKRVRLGIAAPLGTPIHRNEIWRRICQANGNGCHEDGAGSREENGAGSREEGGAGSRESGTGMLPASPGRTGETPEPSTGSEPPAPPASGAVTAPDDLDGSLARWIVRRTGGRIRSLSVQRVGGRLLIQGSTRSYYARQLAQAAVSEMLGALGGAAPAEVDFSIHVLND